jgi:hypothetical protein
VATRTASLLLQFYARGDLLIVAASLVGGVSIGAIFRLIPWWCVLVGIGLLVLYAVALAVYEKIKEGEDERAALEQQLATAKKRRAVNDLLGNALEEGLSLKQGRMYALESENQNLEDIEISDEYQARYDEEVRTWIDCTYNLINDAFGKAEAERFVSNEGYTDEELIGRELPPFVHLNATQRKYLIPARLSNYLKTSGGADRRSRLSHLRRRSGGTTSHSTRAGLRVQAESGRLTQACTAIYAEAGSVREGGPDERGRAAV